MARDYTFDVKGLIKEIEYKPWADNVSLGEKYGISRERVRQIKEKAIRRLRHTSRNKLLKSYLG